VLYWRDILGPKDVKFAPDVNTTPDNGLMADEFAKQPETKNRAVITGKP